MKHLSDEQLSAYLDGALTGRAAEDAARHIAECQPCREALAELAAQDESLAPLLTHDPGDAYFETFAARVEDRIRAAGLAGAPTRVEGLDLGRLFRSPRALAWAGALAVVVVGGGLALMTTREGISPISRFRRDERFMGASPPAGSRDRAVPPPAAPPATSVPEAQAPSSAPQSAQEERSLASAGAPANDELKTHEVAGQRAASPTRAMEVQRTESGEEVAVKRKDMPSFAPAPVPAPTAGNAGNVAPSQVKKPAQAGLMKQSTPAAAAPSTTARLEEEARARGFAAPPPSAADRKQLDAASPTEPGDVRVCGSVLDSRGRPIPGAQVVASDLGRTTTADASGRFCLSLPPGEHPLTAMAVGYAAGHRTLAASDRDVQLTLAAVPVLEGDGTSLKREAFRYDESAQGKAKLFAQLPDSLSRSIQEAQRLESAAVAKPSAAAFDAAAGAWEKSLRSLAGSPLEIETRRHLATARYRAWELTPTSARTRAAVDALTAYVARAPAGPERTQASAWLDQLRP